MTNQQWKRMTDRWTEWKRDLAKAGSLWELGYQDGYQDVKSRSTRTDYINGYRIGAMDRKNDTL